MSLTKDLTKKIGDMTISSLGNSPNPSDFFASISNTMSKLEQSEQIIKKKIKKSDITNMLSNKKPKMTKPIGKLYSIGKSETKEVTGSGSAGGFEALFGEGEMNEKWSQKYKDSIDCNNPKGFSQRAHCVGKKKTQKGEFKEATSSASSGIYDAPGFEDVKMKGNHPIGSGSSFKYPQIHKGQFVTIKKKCKKFPYCNQGDINALKLTNEEIIKKTISDLSKKYNISEQLIEKMIINHYSKIK